MTKIHLPQGPALILRLLGLLWVAVGVMLVSFKPGVINVSTVTSVLQFTTILALVSLGQGLVILAGGAGIDLSVGGMVSLSAILGMMAVRYGLPPVVLPCLCVFSGLLLGAINGLLVTRLSILPLIATLGTLFVYSGVAVAITGGATMSGAPDWLLAWGRGVLVAIPVPFLALVVPAFLIAIVLLSSSSWGRWIYAMGFNERSSRLVGIPVDAVRTILYSASGALAGAAGLASLAWLGSARPNIGQDLELQSLTAVMLGGVSILGGRGGIGGILAAVLLLVTLKTALLQMNVNTVWQLGIVGALLIGVLIAERLAQHWR
jgi:ribose transport system permease protein